MFVYTEWVPNSNCVRSINKQAMVPLEYVWSGKGLPEEVIQGFLCALITQDIIGMLYAQELCQHSDHPQNISVDELTKLVVKDIA